MTWRPLAYQLKRESENTVSWQSAMPSRLPPMTFQSHGFPGISFWDDFVAYSLVSVGKGNSIAGRQLRVALDNCYL